MIYDSFYIKDWKIVILYDTTCDDTDIIIETLMDINCPKRYIKEALDNLETCNLNIGLTYSNIKQKSSVIIISKTSSDGELFNTISHEYFHLICHISKGLSIRDEEELASLNGNLNMHSYNFLNQFYEKVDS